MARNRVKIDYPSPTIENIASIENLFFAWKKLENEFSFFDVWYEEESFKSFKFNLKSELSNLRNEILTGTYKLCPIHLIPFPKSGVDKVRQSFRIAVRDQVAWVAVCNILGPFAEIKMPAWSFGNRLFVPMWKEHQIPNNEYDEVKFKWRNGKFLNSNGRVYQPWNRSWPRFRHLLTATMKRMAFIELDKEENEYVEGSSKLEPWLKLDYLNKDYFKEKQGTKSQDDKDVNQQSNFSEGKPKQSRDIYWATIDLTKFYPFIKCPRLYEKLIKYCRVSEKKTKDLLQRMLKFEVVEPEYAEDDLERLGLKQEKWKTFEGLPTGLLVGGWLANIYLLDVDLEIDTKLKNNKNVAHFRYVDDHTFLSYSPKELIHWVQNYCSILEKLELEVNSDKFQPHGGIEIKSPKDSNNEQNAPEYTLGKAFLEEHWDEQFFGSDSTHNEPTDEWERYEEIVSIIEDKCKIDPRFPSPLMTQTLQKVSQLGSLDLDLLNDREISSVIHDLKTLIVTDFPNEEIKEDTRVSFASTMLSRMLRGRNYDYGLISTFRKQWMTRRYFLIEGMQKQRDNVNEIEDKLPVNAIFGLPIKIEKTTNLNIPDYGDPELKRINSQILNVLYSSDSIYTNTCKSVFSLLKKAASKVPDKVKIWIRLTQFCIDHLPDKLHEVFSLLVSTNGKTLNPLGFRFILSQLYSLISTILVRKSWDYYFSSSESLEEAESRRCMDAIISINPVKSSFSFEKSSLRLFQLSLDFTRFIVNVKETGDLSFDLEVDEKTKLFVVLWLLDGVPKNKQRDFNILFLFPSILNSITEDNPLLEPLMRYIITSKYTDVDRSLIKRLLKITNSEELTTLKLLKEEKNKKQYNEGKILLKDFIDGVFSNIRNSEWENSLRNARLSELFMLKLCQSIISAVNDSYNTDYTDFLDCDHIIVNVGDIHNVWNTSGFKGEIRVSFITDKQIGNSFILLNEDFQMKRLYRIGVVLFNLLSHETDLYWLQVRPEYGYEWTSQIRQLAESGKIGSYSERLLSGCLLPTARELSRLKVTTENVRNVVSSYFASSYIPHIGILADMIMSHLESMTYAIVPITDKTVRELKIIDLD